MKYLLILTTIWSVSLFASVNEYKDTLKAARQNSAVAQNELGDMYRDGNYEGVDQNYSRAVKWYRKAADQGYADAQSNLGFMYGNGKGVPQNDAEAVKWYRKAADQGDASAQSNLGTMYYLGEGIPENTIKAYVWFSMAKTQGETKASTNLDLIKPEMTKQQIADAQTLAAKCYESDYKDCD